MPSTRIDLNFISIGCNRVASCAHWAQNNGLVAYSANKFVALYDPLKVPLYTYITKIIIMCYFYYAQLTYFPNQLHTYTGEQTGVNTEGSYSSCECCSMDPAQQHERSCIARAEY